MSAESSVPSKQTSSVSAVDRIGEHKIQPGRMTLIAYVIKNAAKFDDFLQGYTRSERGDGWNFLIESIAAERTPEIINRETVETYMSHPAARKVRRAAALAKRSRDATPGAPIEAEQSGVDDPVATGTANPFIGAR